MTEVDDAAYCDKTCKREKLERARANNAKEVKIDVDGIEININLEQLATKDKGEGAKSAIEEIMESVEDMPAEIQMAVFSAVLQENAKYKEQEREIK